MKNIYLFDELQSSRQNGIGTFCAQLSHGIAKNKDYNLTIIHFNSDKKHITKTKRNNIASIEIPQMSTGNWNQYGILVVATLRSLVSDNIDNIFVINHSPAARLVDSIRKIFPLSKVVFIIHDQGWCQPLLGDSSLLERILKSKKITHPQITSFTQERIKQYILEEKNVYNSVNKIICISKATAHYLKTIYNINEHNIAHIYNGYTSNTHCSLSKSEIRDNLGFPHNSEILIYAGRPARSKGIIPLLKAVTILKGTHPNIKCILCGTIAGYAQYNEYIKPIASSLIFTGLLERSSLNVWYKAADIGVFPSYSEQFGYAAIEMADNELPLVVSDGNGLKELFHDNVDAYVATIGDDVFNDSTLVNSLVNKIHSLLVAPKEEIVRLQKNMHRRILSDLSMNQMCTNYIKLFNTL